MKSSGRILLLGALLGAPLSAAPFLAVGDNAELFLTGSIAVRLDDNIYLNPASTKKDDTVWSFTPGVDLVFGKGSATQGNLYYRREIVRYSDNRNQNTELDSFGLKSLYDGGKSKFDLAASYAELAQNDNNVIALGDIVDREVSHFHAKPEFGLTDKTSLGIGVTYDKIDYGPAGYSDLSAFALPIDVYFEYSPKMQISVGYRYRDNNVGGAAIDSKDHFVSIGARGEFTPKLTGQVRVGSNSRKFDRGGDDSGLGLEGNLTYVVTDKSSVSLDFSNDYNNAANGDPTERFQWGLSANSQVSDQVSLNGRLTYMSIDYPGRTDTYVEGTVAAVYTYDTTVNFVGSFTYRNNYAGRGGIDFENNVFSFGANIRY